MDKKFEKIIRILKILRLIDGRIESDIFSKVNFDVDENIKERFREAKFDL